ncbi:phosphoglycerate kinase, partial [Halorubrum sp. SS5]
LPEASPEEKAETEFVETLAPRFDAYVNDAYSAAHRRHASLVGFPLVLPAYAGRVMETEYEANTAIATREFDGPVTMVVGGTKATDVIGVMDALDDRVDRFLL